MSKIAVLFTVVVLLCFRAQLHADESRDPTADTRALEQLIRGNTAAQQGNAYQAIYHFQEAVRFDPRSPFLHVALAEQYAVLDQMDRALDELGKALSLKPSYSDALHMKARILATSGNHKDARSAFESLIKIDSTNADFKIELIGLCLAQGDFDRVDALFDDVPLEHDLRGDLIRRIVAIYLAGGDVSRSTRYLEELASTDSTEAAVAYTLGTVYLQSGDTVRALSEIERAIKADSTDSRAWYVRIVIEYDRENYEGSLSLCERAEAAAGEDARTKNLEGLSHLRLGDSTRAVASIARALTLDSTLFTAAGSLALIYDKYDSLGRVEQLYESAIRYSDSAAVYLNNLAYSYAERGVNLDRAMVLVELALGKDPKNSSYLDTKGWIYYRLGDYSKAMTLIRQALKYDRESAALHEHAGDVASAMNQKSKALKYYRRALYLDPNSATLHEKIGR